MSRILVTGGANGLGKEIVSALERQGHWVMSYDKEEGKDVLEPRPWARYSEKAGLPLDVLINNAAINRGGWMDSFAESDWDDIMDVNVKGIFKMSQAFLPALQERQGTILNIVSNSSHVPMRCSSAYNASKGAAHILTLQMARELRPRHGVTVFGISPNKLKGTPMSREVEAQVVKTRGWTPEYAAEYQLNALSAGEETDPKQLAEFIAYLLTDKNHHKFLNGCILPYGA